MHDIPSLPNFLSCGYIIRLLMEICSSSFFLRNLATSRNLPTCILSLCCGQPSLTLLEVCILCSWWTACICFFVWKFTLHSGKLHLPHVHHEHSKALLARYTANYTCKYRLNGTALYKLDIACLSPRWDCCSTDNPVITGPTETRQGCLWNNSPTTDFNRQHQRSIIVYR